MLKININDIVNLLGLTRQPRAARAGSYNVRCPFCGDTGYHLNVNTQKNVYNCFKCSGGGALDLYSRARFGRRYKSGDHEVLAALFEELNISQEENHRASDYKRSREDYYEESAIYPAEDSKLNEAYSGLLAFKPFALTNSHFGNLLSRGLSEESIQRNGYRTIPEDLSFIEKCPDFLEMAVPLQKSLYAKGFKKSIYQIATGLIVADGLIKRGISLAGVPGFYKLGGKWIFNLSSGMLIPTRNMKGEIVGLQVRRDSSDLRYLTISSKGLPEGVTDHIFRTHFPLANPDLRKCFSIMLTEGPLKADVACELSGGGTPYMALQGVNNRADLPMVFAAMKKQGIKRVVNTFDMDKIINPHVAAASRSLEKLISSHGLKSEIELWDEVGAKEMLDRLLSIAKERGVEVQLEVTDTVYMAASYAAQVLYRSGKAEDFFKEKKYWPPQTKGVDDYLLSLKKARGVNLISFPNQNKQEVVSEEKNQGKSSFMASAAHKVLTALNR